MQWLDRLIEKWNNMMAKIRPYYDAVAGFFRRVGKKLSAFWKYVYMLRGIILAAPVAAAAVIIGTINLRRLPSMVSIVSFTIDRGDPDALFGFLSIYPQSISREMAVFGPLTLTAVALVMMLLSKRTLYPFFISVMTLILPFFIWFYNVYPM